MATRKRKGARAEAARRPSKSKKTSPKPAAGRRGAARAARPAAPKTTPRRQPEALRLRSFSAGFTADDLNKSVAFYTDVLGFIVGERWTDDAGKLQGVTLKAGSCELNVSQDDWGKGRDRQKGVGVRLWCETIQNVDALAARVKAAGYELSEDVGDRSWGIRSFSLDDPDGFHLTIFREL